MCISQLHLCYPINLVETKQFLYKTTARKGKLEIHISILFLFFLHFLSGLVPDYSNCLFLAVSSNHFADGILKNMRIFS